jgi:hypothetical protein
MLEVKGDDLPTPVVSKLAAATDALAAVLVEAEGFRGARDAHLP